MELTGAGTGVPVPVALAACAGMTILYVGILHTPTLILRLPPPSSYKSFMIRRFVCAGISTVVSLIACAFILPIKSWEVSDLFSAYGIHLHHAWQAVVFPLFLTSLMYAGSFFLKILSLWSLWAEQRDHQIDLSLDGLQNVLRGLINWMLSFVDNIPAWRIYLVAPLTEELVFRACMIPLLLCGGFKPYTVVLLSPVYFSLGPCGSSVRLFTSHLAIYLAHGRIGYAHLNHLLEFYLQQEHSLLKASMVVGFQLGYTVIFGSYASFLFIRTGHIAAPLMSHMFCNFMGLPTFFSRRTGMVSVAFIAGAVGFLYLVFPLTSPGLYNDRTDGCKCWHKYCDWS